MPKEPSILCFHGLGDHRSSNWEREWRESIRTALDPAGEIDFGFQFPTNDAIFEKVEISFEEAVRAFWKLARSGISEVRRRHRGFLGGNLERLRWTAGSVVARAEDGTFRQETRKFVLDLVKAFKPDLILANSRKWDLGAEMWVDPSFERLNRECAPKSAQANRAFFGSDGATVRLGRAAMLRMSAQEEYKKAAAKAKKPAGPFLPLIIRACEEQQLPYQYRHGATSYGAFTFCLASILRRDPGLTFQQLVAGCERSWASLATSRRRRSWRPAPCPMVTGRAPRRRGRPDS